LRKFVNQHGLLEDSDKVVRQRKKFEKEFINELWMVDFKEGKRIRKGKRLVRTYLCAIIDDASRVIVGYQWGLLQDSALFAKTLKKAIAVYGIPKILYCDQAKVFRSTYIMQICAKLEISLVNAPPYSPESKAKIERFNRTIQQMFYPLVPVKDFASLSIDELNQLFAQFIDELYHPKIHTSLDEAPLKKFQRLLKEVPIRRKTNEQLEQIFLCSMRRKVRLDGTISIDKVYYEVAMKYVGEWVEVRFALDNPNRYFLFEEGQLVGQLKPVDLVQNANPPHVTISYSKLLKK
jgi:transposase InsO family protein